LQQGDCITHYRGRHRRLSQKPNSNMHACKQAGADDHPRPAQATTHTRQHGVLCAASKPPCLRSEQHRLGNGGTQPDPEERVWCAAAKRPVHTNTGDRELCMRVCVCARVHHPRQHHHQQTNNHGVAPASSQRKLPARPCFVRGSSSSTHARHKERGSARVGGGAVAEAHNSAPRGPCTMTHSHGAPCAAHATKRAPAPQTCLRQPGKVLWTSLNRKRNHVNKPHNHPAHTRWLKESKTHTLLTCQGSSRRDRETAWASCIKSMVRPDRPGRASACVAPAQRSAPD
jgi:hypothetical protein